MEGIAEVEVKTAERADDNKGNTNKKGITVEMTEEVEEVEEKELYVIWDIFDVNVVLLAVR